MVESFLVTGYVALFIFLILRSPGFELKTIPRTWLAFAFLMKVLAGISLGLVYKYYYADKATSDTFKFFNDSKIIFDTLFTVPFDFLRMLTGIGSDAPELRHYYIKMDSWLNTDVLFNDNKTIIRLNVLFHFFSLGKYYVHVVFLNFISFIGLFVIYKTFIKYKPCVSRLLFFSTFLLPSVLFWGSGLLKDGLLLFAFGMMIYSYDRILSGEKKLNLLLLFAGSFSLLVFTKLYVLICIFPGVIAWYWSKSNLGRNVVLKFTVCYVLYFIVAFNLYRIAPKYDVADIIYWKQKNFNALAEFTKATSVIEIPQLDYGFKSILINSPTAFFNTLLRPFLSDVHGNKMILASAIENIFILGFCMLCILYRNKKHKPVKPIHIFSVFFVLLMFVLSGLITPILGALVRYKVPALPFLLFLFISMLDHDRLLHDFNRIKNKLFRTN